MKSLNKVHLIGYTCSDPEIKTIEKIGKMAKFTLATNRLNAKKEQIAEFHKIIAWRHLAEIVESYIKKGKGLYVEGSLQTNSWEDKEGNKKYSTEIIANEISLLTSKKEESKTKNK